MSKYPNHVAKVVFYSPGPIWGYASLKEDDSRTGGERSGFPSLRFLAAMSLFDRNPDASEALLPQLEAEELVVPVIAPVPPSFVCKGDASKLPELGCILLVPLLNTVEKQRPALIIQHEREGCAILLRHWFRSEAKFGASHKRGPSAKSLNF